MKYKSKRKKEKPGDIQINLLSNDNNYSTSLFRFGIIDITCICKSCRMCCKTCCLHFNETRMNGKMRGDEIFFSFTTNVKFENKLFIPSDPGHYVYVV